MPQLLSPSDHPSWHRQRGSQDLAIARVLALVVDVPLVTLVVAPVSERAVAVGADVARELVHADAVLVESAMVAELLAAVDASVLVVHPCA